MPLLEPGTPTTAGVTVEDVGIEVSPALARPPSATTDVTDEQAAVLAACECVLAEEFTDHRLVEELPAKHGARQYHVLAKGLAGDDVRDVEFVVTASSASPAGLTKAPPGTERALPARRMGGMW